MSNTISVATRDGGAMPAETFYPEAETAKGIVMVPAIYGLDDGAREIVADYVEAGYVVMAPDMFWRTCPGPLGREGADKDKAQERYAAFDAEQGVADLADAIGALRADPRCTGKVAVLGYCFGGRYAFLAAARLGVDGAVSFHGTKIGLNLGEAANVACPLSIHVGDADPSVPMDEVRATQAALEGVKGASVHVYPGCVHGFTGRGRPSFDAHADAGSRRAALDILAAM